MFLGFGGPAMTTSAEAQASAAALLEACATSSSAADAGRHRPARAVGTVDIRAAAVLATPQQLGMRQWASTGAGDRRYWRYALRCTHCVVVGLLEPRRRPVGVGGEYQRRGLARGRPAQVPSASASSPIGTAQALENSDARRADGGGLATAATWLS